MDAREEIAAKMRRALAGERWTFQGNNIYREGVLFSSTNSKIKDVRYMAGFLRVVLEDGTIQDYGMVGK